MKTLRDLDGMSIKDANNMPHPCDLATWSDDGLYAIDLDKARFVLTEKGKLTANSIAI